jgi:hypothetical protein
MLTRKTYKLEKPILYNNIGVTTFAGRTLDPEDVAKIGGFRRVMAGSFLCNSGRLLPRAEIISPYTSAATQVVVSNPSAFQVGDILRLIGTPSSTPYQEAQAVDAATAPLFGTVTGWDKTYDYQKTTVTPNSVAVGNIFTVDIDGVLISFTALTTSNADVVNGLLKQFQGMRSPNSTLWELDVTATSTQLVIKHQQPREIFKVKTTVAQGAAVTTGTLVAAITEGVGTLLITPQAGNGNQLIGAKIGTITDVPIGVITQESYLTDDDGVDVSIMVSAYEAAGVFTKSLPYLDGSIVAKLPKLTFVPPYGV